jgi:preprotein translocase SecE subunit
MNQKPQENYLLIIKEKIKGALKESKNLTMPSMKETVIKTLLILIIAALMIGFLLLMGEIVVKLLKLII